MNPVDVNPFAAHDCNNLGSSPQATNILHTPVMARLEHVGIAVGDPGPVTKLLESLLGLTPYKTEIVEREGVRTHFLDAGTVKVELLEALDDDSPVARFLRKRGEGIHHLSFEVEDVQAAIDRGRSMGLQPLSEEPLSGADGKRVVFFHPRDTHGILIEVCEAGGEG